jgi:L-malate glycosyltransferase
LRGLNDNDDKKNAQMKVAIITSWLNRRPNDLMDSTGIFVREQAQAMQILGVEVALFFPDLMPHRDASFFVSQRHLDTEGGIPTFRIQQFHLPKWSLFLLKSYIKKAATLYDDYFKVFGKPDLIHAHNYWVGFVAQAIKEKHGIPYVFTEHDTVFFEGRFRPWLVPLMTKMLQEASAITAVSQGLKEALKPFSEKPISVVPNIINTQVFQPKEAFYKKKFGSEETCQFVSIGGLYPYKGYDLLLTAFAQFLSDNPNVSAFLTIIGAGTERVNLERQATQLHINQCVVFKGQLTTKEIVTSLSQSDIFISSSRFETFGVAMAEAMAMGLPILATPTDGAKDIMRAETGVLTTDISVAAITEGLTKMYLEHQKFDASKIRQHVLDNFDKTIVAERYLEIYRKAIG